MADGVCGYIPELPDNIRGIFTDLCQAVASLYAKWQLYLDLFSSHDEAVVLSQMAVGTFQIMEEALRGDIMMAVCRLGDPHQSCGNDNLSIVTLVRRVGQIEGLDQLVQQ